MLSKVFRFPNNVLSALLEYMMLYDGLSYASDNNIEGRLLPYSPQKELLSFFNREITENFNDFLVSL